MDQRVAKASVRERLVPSAAAFAVPGLGLVDELGRVEMLLEVNNADAVVFHCNRVLEALAREAVATLGIEGIEHDPNAFGNLETLRCYGLMPDATLAWAHTLRLSGNAARHVFRPVDLGEAELAVAFTERLLDWYFCRYRFGPKLAAVTGELGLGFPILGSLRELLARLEDARAVDPAVWEDVLSRSASLTATMAKLLVERAQHAEAEAVLTRGLVVFQGDMLLQQIMGLHLSRRGQPEEALKYLEPLHQRYPNDEETAGILGGVWKRIWRKSDKVADLRRAHDFYRKGWKRALKSDRGTGYLGVNAAATALWLGDMEAAKTLADQTYGLIEGRHRSLPLHADARGIKLGYWDQVTWAETSLLAGKPATARHFYRQAFDDHPERTGDEGSVRAQLKLHLQLLNLASDVESFLAGDAADSSDPPLPKGDPVPAKTDPVPAYVPKPLPTESLVLPNDLAKLVEMLSENAHDVWALGRIQEGWSWGPTRDDAEKKHPDLVPYAELSDGEKAYDRRMTEGTLRAIIALGYRIEKA